VSKIPAFQLTDTPIKVHTSANSVNSMTLTNSGTEAIPIKMNASWCGKLTDHASFSPSSFVLKPGSHQQVKVTLTGANPGTVAANANVVTGHAQNGASVGLTLDTQFVVAGSHACVQAVPKPTVPAANQGFPTWLIPLVGVWLIFGLAVTLWVWRRKHHVPQHAMPEHKTQRCGFCGNAGHESWMCDQQSDGPTAPTTYIP
jgi:hypothetical protein